MNKHNVKGKATSMKVKTSRLETIKALISSMELCSQEEVLRALKKEGFTLTQATLSRDLKQLKVAKAASMSGKYVYVLPNDTMYRRVSTPKKISEMLVTSGFVSLNYSGNIGVIKTRPGYASSIAYNIDNSDIPEILGTIAGDDTIMIIIREGSDTAEITKSLDTIIPITDKQTTKTDFSGNE
jgi:transcriptional regulator of arginine metabolism